MSSSMISTLLILGLAVGAGLAIWKRCEWFGMCGDIEKDIKDTINAISGGGLTSISSEHEVADAITQQGIQHKVATDPTSKLGEGPYTTGTGRKGGMSLVPLKNANAIKSSVVTGKGGNCQAGTKPDGSGGCVYDPSLSRTQFARAMSAMTVTGGRLSYF